jgi:hypothetical protein
MTKQEKKRLSSVLRATEYLFLENIALKLVLEHREIPNWQKLLDHLLADKEMLAGVRLKFRDVYNEIEGSANPFSRTNSPPESERSPEKYLGRRSIASTLPMSTSS